MEEKDEILYNNLNKKGLYTKTYEDFKAQFAAPEKQAKLHAMLTDKGLYTKSVGDFQAQFFTKKEEAGSTVSPLESAQNPSDSDSQLETKPLSDLVLSDLSSLSQQKREGLINPDLAKLAQMTPDERIARLYDKYKEAGQITLSQEKEIDAILDAQKKGDRSTWESVGAFADGMLRTGMMIPIYQYDNKEDLLQKRAVKNRINFLQELPEDVVKELNAFAVNRSIELDKESQNILAENKVLEEKSILMVKNMEHLNKSIQTLKDQGREIPKEARDFYLEKYEELKNIGALYNSNIDLIESNSEDIGDFYEEIELLKKNYGGLDYYKDLSRLATADIISGIMEFGVSTAELATTPQGVPLFPGGLPNAREFNAEFREEIDRQRDLLKPAMSVEDIDSPRVFGKWLAEQTATQLPTVTVLMASGGTAGLTTIGASSAGQKMGEMRDTNAKGETQYSNAEIYTAGVAVGTLEALTERVTVGILSKGKRALTAAKRTSQDEIKKGVKDYVFGFTKDAFSEGGSEFINKLSQNVVDIMYLENDDVHVLDGTVDALASGFALGAGMSGAPTIIGLGTKALTTKENSAEIRNNSKKMETLINELETNKNNLTPESVTMMENEIKDLAKLNNKKFNQVFNDITRLPKENIQELIDLDKSSNKLVAQVKNIKDSKLPADIQTDLLNKLKVKADEIGVRKTEILEKVRKDGRKQNAKPEEAAAIKEANKVDPEKTVIPRAEGSDKVQGEDGNQPSVAVDGDGVQQDSNGNTETTEFQAFENRLDSAEVQEISNIDLSEDLGLNKMVETLEKWDKDLGDFGKGTLGMNIPVAVAQTAVKAMKVAMATAKTGADVLSAGINALKNTDWYKGLTPVQQTDAERDIMDAIATMGKTKPVTPKVKDDAKTTLKKLVSGFPLITYIDEKVSGVLAKRFSEYMANKTQDALVSQNKIKRFIAQSVTNWYNGLPRTDEQLSEKRRVSGKQELAFIEGAKLTKELQTLINFDQEAAKRVHMALDPDLYDDVVEYDDLTVNEKNLFDQLRAINEQTHETNYELGFIDDDTYEKFKGNYIGRGYEVYEGLQEEIEKANFINNKIFDKIYKQRKDIDQWKIDNTVNDPIYLTINRMIQTKRNAAVKAYADLVAKQDNTVSNEAQEGFTQLNGKAYGKLNGKYVVNYIAEDFQGYFYAGQFMDSLYDVVKLYDKNKVRQFLKKHHTVYSPVVQLGNFLSNNAFAIASGVNLPHLWRHLPDARKDILAKDGDYLTLVENGIVGADILTNDLKMKDNIRGEAIQKFQNRWGKIFGKTENKADELKFEKGLDKIQQLDDWAQRTYATSDDVMKLAAYKAMRASGFTESQAIQKVFEGFQNYATVGKIWDFASKTPIIGNAYVKFQADLQRIIKNAVTKRPLTTATFLGGIKLMAIIASELSGESDEEREIREARPFIPKMNLGVFDIPLVFKMGDKELNVARFISPYYEYDIPNKTWLEAASNFTPFQWRSEEAKELGQSSGGFDTPDVLLGSFWAAFVSNKDFRGKSITDPYATRFKESGLSDSEKFLNRLEYVSRSVVPLFSTAQDLYMSQMYGEDFYGRDKDILDVVISKVAKIQTYDKESLNKTIKSNINTINYNQKIINNKIKSIRKKLQNEAVKAKRRFDEGKISEAKMNSVIQAEAKSAQKRINKQLHLLVKQQEKLNKLVVDVNNIK